MPVCYGDVQRSVTEGPRLGRAAAFPGFQAPPSRQCFASGSQNRRVAEELGSRQGHPLSPFTK